MLPEGGTQPVPIGASLWGPARRNGELGHGRAHGTGTVGYHGLTITGTPSEPALQLTFP